MIKHLFTTLCALALITAGSIPALAAEADTSESARYYPISTVGGCFALFFAVFRSICLSCVAVFLRSLHRFQVA